MRHAKANRRCTVFVSWFPGRAPLPFHPTNQPNAAHPAAPTGGRRPRLSLARSCKRATRRPCSMLSEQPQHRTTSLPPPPPATRRAGTAAGLASVDQQRGCRSAASEAMAFIRLSLSDQPFNGGGPNIFGPMGDCDQAISSHWPSDRGQNLWFQRRDLGYARLV